VVFAMTLVACFRFLRIVPLFSASTDASMVLLNAGGKTDWEKFGILDYLPKKLVSHACPGDERRSDATGRPLSRYLPGWPGHGEIGLTVCRGAHAAPLTYWMPLIILMSVCVMAMSLLVHRQWSDHEQLSYPIAQVASAFTRREKERGCRTYSSPICSGGEFVPIFLLYALEYIHLWSRCMFPA